MIIINNINNCILDESLNTRFLIKIKVLIIFLMIFQISYFET